MNIEERIRNGETVFLPLTDHVATNLGLGATGLSQTQALDMGSELIRLKNSGQVTFSESASGSWTVVSHNL